MTNGKALRLTARGTNLVGGEEVRVALEQGQDDVAVRVAHERPHVGHRLLHRRAQRLAPAIDP